MSVVLVATSQIPKSSDDKHWWEYINSSVDLNMLNRVADEFLKIYESCPSKIRKKMLNQLKGKQAVSHADHESHTSIHAHEMCMCTCSVFVSHSLQGSQAAKVQPSGGEPSSSGSHQPAPPPPDLQHSYLKPLPPRDRPKPPPQPGTTQQQSTSTDKPDPSVPASSAGSGKKPLVAKTLPVLPPLTMSEEKKPLVLPPLPRREGEERSRSPRDSIQADKRSSSAQQRPSSHGHHKYRHGEGHPPPPPHRQKHHDSPTTSSHQLHQHTSVTNQTSAHGGHKRQRNVESQPHDAKRHKMELQPLPQQPPPPPPHRHMLAGQKPLGDPVRPDAIQHRLRFEAAKTVAPSSSLGIPPSAYSPISPPAPLGLVPPPPPPPLPPSKPPLPPPPLPPTSRPM